MKYNNRFNYYIKSWLFRKLFLKNHKNLTEKTVYFSVFLDDAVSNAVQVTSLYENEILIPLFNILSKEYNFLNTSAIDIGANIGNHTVFFSSYFKRVISYEPNPITFKLLSVNTDYLQNVEVHNFGFSDVNSEQELSVLKGNFGASSAVIDYKSGISHSIKLIRLDDINVKIYGIIGLIKIDVEGMEKNVLMGAINTITSNLPIILFEQLRSSFVNVTSNPIDILKNAGYNIYIIKESHYSSNKWLRRLKRLPLMITNGSLNHSLEKFNEILPRDYDMLIAIHQSKINLDNTN